MSEEKPGQSEPTASGVALSESGLPAGAYVDEGFFRREQERIFERQWVCVATLDDVPAPGDVIPLTCAGKSLILAHGQDGQVRAFHNYCRHRGMRLVNEPCTRRTRLVCPYHSWVYKLDGTLARTPHFRGMDQPKPTDDGAALPKGLAPIRTAQWNRLIFIDLSGDAGSFEAHIGPLEQRWKDYDFSGIRHAVSARYEVACNWKLAVENFVDIYHIPFVHPGLNAYSDMRDHYTVTEPTLFGEGNPKVYPEDAAVGKLPDFPGLPADKQNTLEALCLFPNLLVTVTRDYLRVIVVEPTGPDSCRERVEIFVANEAAMTPELAEYRQVLLKRFAAFNAEDVDVCEELQRSMATSAFGGPKFVPLFDDAVRLFQTRVAEAMARS